MPNQTQTLTTMEEIPPLNAGEEPYGQDSGFDRSILAGMKFYGLTQATAAVMKDYGLVDVRKFRMLNPLTPQGGHLYRFWDMGNGVYDIGTFSTLVAGCQFWLVTGVLAVLGILFRYF